MSRRCVASLAVLAGVLAFAVLTTVSASGQAAKPGPATSPAVTRTSDGQPDIQGTWTYFDRVNFETAGTPTRRRAGESAEEAGVQDALAGGSAGRYQRERDRQSLVIFPKDGKVPVLQKPVDQLNFLTDHFYDSYVYQSEAERCITRGVPGSGMPNGYNSAMQIVQTPGFVAMVYEMIHEPRVIPVTGNSPHPPPSVRQWRGDSRGHWDGNTLVVDTTNYNNKGSATPQAGADHLRSIRQSEALHVVERFTVVSRDKINLQVTIEDPNVYAGPWTVAYALTRDDSYKIYEFACHEGNITLRNSLRAGRYRDNPTAISDTRKAAEEEYRRAQKQ